MTRFYKNNLPLTTSEKLLDDASNKLCNAASSEIEGILNRLLAIVQMNERSTSKNDCSIYTGKSGLAYLYLSLSTRNENFMKDWAYWSKKSLDGLRGRDVTFLCGDVGPLCVAAVLRYKQGRMAECKELIGHILTLSPMVVTENIDMPNELLYGRVGYLYGLLFIQNKIPDLDVPLPIQQVAKAVLSAGITDHNSPLMWNWHGKKYLGAAHGVAGILYLLLEVRDVLDVNDMLLIKGTVDFLLKQRYESGNLPSSIGSSDDRLVHWCHGAPGFVQVLLKAYEVWKEKCYLEAAELCGEIVWQRGLLKKGYGICHGVAGNAYTFLALFQATHQEIHLYRSVQFARWCGTYDQQQEHPPDRPFSLFEGLAGTVYFLNDILDPYNACFPAFSLSSFRKI